VKRAARSYDLDPQAVQSALAEIDATDLWCDLLLPPPNGWQQIFDIR
jgi:hypothetical protein